METLEESFLDTLHVCRICSDTKRKANNLYKTKLESANVVLHEVFVDITNINITENDGLPQELCSLCTTRLLDAYKLKRQAEEANQLFAKQLENTICHKHKIIKKKEEEKLNIMNKNYFRDAWANKDKFDVESCDLSEEYVNHYNYLHNSFSIEELEIILGSEEYIEVSEDGVELLTLSTDELIPQKIIDTRIKVKHQCEVCTREFSRKSNLVDHLRLHANMKPFQCKYCNKAFVQIANYRTHLRIHTNERPYKCYLCPKSYNQSSSLKIHFRSHTNERNYSCHVCGKAFTNSSDLNKHKRLHNPELQFKCEVCGKLFAQKVNMILHKRRLHYCDRKETNTKNKP